MLFQPAQQIVFLGAQASQGKDGLVERIAERFAQRQSTLRIINASRPTQTLETALLEIQTQQADWFVLWFGAPEALWGSEVKHFQKSYHLLLQALHAKNAKVILCEPVLVEANPHHPDWLAVQQHRQAVLELAAHHNLGVVALQNPFHRVLGGTRNSDWAQENRLYFNRFGSALAAEEFLAAIGFEVFEDDDEPPKENP